MQRPLWREWQESTTPYIRAHMGGLLKEKRDDREGTKRGRGVQRSVPGTRVAEEKMGSEQSLPFIREQ